MTWEIIRYVLAILFPIAGVAVLRSKAYDWGQNWLATGRFAIVGVYVIAFVFLLVTGRFEALQDPQQLTELLKQAWIIAGGAIGTHTVAKTLKG